MIKRLYILILLSLALATSCDHKIDPPVPVVIEQNCYFLDLSLLDFDTTPFFYIKDKNSNIIAYVSREYLGTALDKQAVLVYTMEASNMVSVDSIFVSRITLTKTAKGYSQPKESIHGGTLCYFYAENAYYYNDISKASEEPIDELFIKVRDDGSTFVKLESNSTSLAQYTPYTLSYNGYEYPIVKIGNSLWTTQNLRTTKYADGSAIPTSGKWSLNESNIGTSKNTEAGMLYNAYSLGFDNSDSEEGNIIFSPIAPEGWRIPTAKTGGDWYQLESFAANSSALRSTGTNITGFSIIPFGRITSSGVQVEPEDDDHIFWSSTNSTSTKAYFAKIFYKTEGDKIQYFSATDKRTGFGVRLVKDF